MLDTAQAAGVLIGGILLVLLLVWILVLVHAQAQKIRRIESQLNIVDKAVKEEDING